MWKKKSSGTAAVQSGYFPLESEVCKPAVRCPTSHSLLRHKRYRSSEVIIFIPSLTMKMCLTKLRLAHILIVSIHLYRCNSPALFPSIFLFLQNDFQSSIINGSKHIVHGPQLVLRSLSCGATSFRYGMKCLLLNENNEVFIALQYYI